MALVGGTRWTGKSARAAFAAAPVVDLGALCPGGSLLVVAPHPDDESLGCGGLIALAAGGGCHVTVAALTDGRGSHPNSHAFPAERLVELRRAELAEAVDLLASGRAEVETFGAQDGQLQGCEGAAQAWLAHLAGRKPFDAVFVTWEADPHPDHKAAFRITERQVAVWGTALFAFPVWGLALADAADAGPAAPCVKLDIGSVLDRKRAAVAAHRSQTTGLIADDPKGFRLSAADLARHLSPYEVFIQAAGNL